MTHHEILAFKEDYFEKDRLKLKKESSNIQLISKLLLNNHSKSGSSIVEFVEKLRAERAVDLEVQNKFIT